MKNYYFVSWNDGNGIYCTNLATAESAEDVRTAYAGREEITVREADGYEIESAKRRGMPVTDCPHIEPEQPETEPETAEETTTNEEETEMKNAEFIAALTAQLATIKNYSAWDRGIQQYAENLAAELAENLNGGYISLDDLRTDKGAEKAMLNGAESWNQYSYGGSALIYDYDIAKRLCNPSELKKARGGERNPNSRETWLDVQARALFQACNRTKKAIRRAFKAVEEVR